MWTCPACRRRFGRNRQSHECAPAMTLDEYFSTGPPFERPVFDAVMAHLDPLGPVYVEPVSVGIFLRHGDSGAKIAELRPKVRWVALTLSLGHPVHDRRMSSRTPGRGGHTWYSIRLAGAGDVDDPVRGWLTEAYNATEQ
jgi:hypothetical protein